MRLFGLADLLGPRQPRLPGANSSGWTNAPLDEEYAVPVPFACGYDDGRASLRTLNGVRVTQCALSRICGVCGQGLERTVVFVGTPEELARNAFHFPPTHGACAESLRVTLHDADLPLPGHEVASTTVAVSCPGFEFVRPSRADVDRRPVFAPIVP